MKPKNKCIKQKSGAAVQVTAPVTVQSNDDPLSPAFLLELAEREENRRPLGDYSEVITVLRNEKKFTFREIANWLQRHGVEADHNAVYREYTKGMRPDDAQSEAWADEVTEREEAGLA